MRRWVGYKTDRVKTISNHLFVSNELSILEVPQELDGIANDELLLARVRNNQIILPSAKKNIKQTKLAIITNIYQKCGLSTYIENLLDPLLKAAGDYRIFAEYNDVETDVEKKWPIIKSWKRGTEPTELIQKIKEYDPDVIWINHEWGLWSNASFWLSMLTQLSEYRVITTLHSVFPYHFDKTICEAAIQEIIVHSEGAKQALEKKGVRAKINIIQHGCYAITNQTKLWNMYQSSHTFVQSGFGFPYKGLKTSIKAAAILKNKYPDVFLTILFSESPFNKVGHQTYYDELMALVYKLNIQNNIAIIRGYQSDEVIDAYYRTNSVAVFPYESNPEHIVFGSSGAIRLAAAKGIPTISSNINHFSGFPSIRINNEQELADALDRLFESPILQKEQVERQNQYIKENSWDNVATQYIKVFEEG